MKLKVERESSYRIVNKQLSITVISVSSLLTQCTFLNNTNVGLQLILQVQNEFQLMFNAIRLKFFVIYL